MASIINESWKLNASVRKSGAAEAGVNIIVWDADTDVPIFNEITNSQGQIPEQTITENVFTVTNTSTIDSDAKTPHTFAIVKYGNFPVDAQLNIGQARNDTFFMEDNTVIVQSTKAQAAALTGITIDNDSDKIFITGAGVDPNDLYDFAQVAAIDSAQKDFPSGIITSRDGVNFTYLYELIIQNNRTLNGTANAGVASFDVSSKGVTLEDSSVITNITLNAGTAGVDYGGARNLTDVTVNGTEGLDFSQAGTYSLSGTTLSRVTNSSGGNITLQLTNSSVVTTNTGPNITIVQNETVNITGLKDGTEVRIFNEGTITEIAGVEDLTGGVGTGLNNGTASGSTNDNTFTFTVQANTAIDIRTLNIDFVADPILDFTVPVGGASIPVAQAEDRVFSNP